jgi:diacylglycerol O-acyltransferase
MGQAPPVDGTPHRLHALDVAWLEMEGDGPPIAIGTASVADGPAPDDGELLDLLAQRLPRMPRLHQHLTTSAGGLRRPMWTEAEDLDLGRHLHRVRAAHSGRDGLDRVVSGVMESRLDRSRPLWDLWVVEGLPDDRWAVVWRVHHSMADGLGALSLLGHGFDVAPNGGLTLAEAVVDAGRRAAAAAHPEVSDHRAGLLGRVTGGLGSTITGTLPHLLPALATAIPQVPSRITGPVGPRRAWSSVDVPLSEVKAVGRAFGATVNDVILAAMAGGFRELLRARGESVHGRVVRNLVPVSVRPSGDDHADNQVSAVLGHLPVGVADPVERLAAVVSTVGHLKASQAPLLVALLLDVVDHAVPAPLQDAVVSTAGRVAPAWFFDTLTTNVPGPQFPVFFAGRRVHAMYPIIPVAGHTRITTGIFSYDGVLNIGCTGDAEHAGDVDHLASGVRGAVAELADRAAHR